MPRETRKNVLNIMTVLFTAATLQVLMGVVPDHMGDVCVYCRVRSGQSEEAGDGH